MSNALAIVHADHVEQIGDTDAAVWSLRIDACTAHERRALIDHHSNVMRLLRERGHRVRAQTVSEDDGQFLTLRIIDRESTWQTPDGCRSV